MKKLFHIQLRSHGRSTQVLFPDSSHEDTTYEGDDKGVSNCLRSQG